MYIFTFAFTGGGLVLIYLAIQRQIWPLLLVALFLAGLGYLLYRMASRTLLSIDETSLSVCSGFATRSALLDEVAGWRAGDKNTIKLELKSGDKALTIPGNLERKKEVKAWVEERFTDIAAQLAQEVTEEVIHDERYGLTEEDRARRLKQARKIAAYGTFASPLLFFFVVFAGQRATLVTLVLLAIPFVSVWLTRQYKGILRLYTSRSKPYPSLLFVVLFAIIAALMNILREYDIYVFDGRAWQLLLGLAVVVTLVWGALCRPAAAGEKNLFAVYAGMLVLAGVYSYNALLFFNCAYDHNREVILRVGVDGKHVNHGKSTSYYLELSPWGRFTEGKNVNVSQSFYRSTRTGDSVNVYLHPGKWGIPWYEVMRD